MKQCIRCKNIYSFTAFKDNKWFCTSCSNGSTITRTALAWEDKINSSPVSRLINPQLSKKFICECINCYAEFESEDKEDVFCSYECNCALDHSLPAKNPVTLPAVPYKSGHELGIYK